MGLHSLVVVFASIIVNTYEFNIRCPNGFISNGSSCYKFVQIHATWPEAKVMCDAMGSHLLEIDTPWEEQFVLERLYLVENTLSEGSLWMGATDMMNDDEWVWMTSGRRIGYRNWKMDEPEAFKHGHGHCLAFTSHPQVTWEEINCKENLNFVCEMNMD